MAGVERDTQCFDDKDFINIGSFLISAQNRQPTPHTTSKTSEEAPPAAGTTASRRIVFSLVVVVGMLLGTNAHLYNSSQALKAERSALKATIAKQSRAVVATCPKVEPCICMPNHSDQGRHLFDTCWLKVGLGDCAEDAFKNPGESAGKAWESAWNSTADAFGAAGENINNVGRGLHSFASATLKGMGFNRSSS